MKIQFIASLPDIYAVAIGGQDKNSRIKLDVPASELAAVVNLLALKSEIFKVTKKDRVDLLRVTK